MSTYNCRGAINGIIVQNNPVNFIDPDGLFSLVKLGEIALVASAGIAVVAGFPVTGGILIGGAIVLVVYDTVIKPLQTIDNKVDRYKSIPGVKEHLDSIEKASKLLKDNTNRLMGCPKNE